MENKNDYTKFDEKTISTIKTSAIWSAIASLIMSLASMLTSYFFIRNIYSNIYGNMMGQYGQYFGGYMNQIAQPQMINFGVLISNVIGGAVGGAIAGWLIAKFYYVFVGWQKKYLGNKLNSFFKILFWPYVVGLAISLILAGTFSIIYSGFTAFIIIIVADLVAMYLYAMMMDKIVGKYYR